MELRQLEYFVAVAEEANFTRAAERVHISQSGVSAQIRQLEQDLGAQLFDRSARAAALTDAGRAALVHARAVLAGADALRQSVDEVSGLLRGRLLVGMVGGCTITPFFEALASFHRAHPGIEVSLVEDASDRLVERVRAGELDLALTGLVGALPAGLGGHALVDERLIAAVPPGHPLAERDGVTLDELCGYPLVCMPQGTGIRAALDEACAARGLRPLVAMQASAPPAIADLAQRGLGAAVLSESLSGLCEGRLRVLPIADADTPALLALLWPTTVGPALRELLRHCAPLREPARV
ncbi:LysR family transcriptional regulator [Streptacidiphilus rugosus]|uniref:LysR family transcriptional regulator n=1 Tax=Streptacidiphilus rugosus TaxID=405783 RepID=UPI0005609FD1|nr:LysR substrate-binding domain-containing protein [Streptacidiphilus rugosus]